MSRGIGEASQQQRNGNEVGGVRKEGKRRKINYNVTDEMFPKA